MRHLNKQRQKTVLDSKSMGRIARLAMGSLGVSCVAVYLKNAAGGWRRAFASSEYPAAGFGEQVFIEALTSASIEVTERAHQSSRLSAGGWLEQSPELGLWASAPVVPTGEDGPAGQLVVAGASSRSCEESMRQTLADLAELVVEQLEARYLHARMAQMDRVITIGTLAAGVAHEINNPLSFVGGNIQFALRLLADDALQDSALAADLTEALNDALEGSRRVRDVVRDLHRLASGSGNSDEFTIEPVFVHNALRTSVNIARNHVEQRANLVCEVEKMPKVMGNESKLGQVFLNLLINAAQAIPRGGMSTNEVRVGTEVRPDSVAVSIADSGVGIAEEHLERIFEPFFSTKATEEGTGLGLAISHHIITTLGGDLEVDTVPGEGTTFRVVLPRADKVGPETSGDDD